MLPPSLCAGIQTMAPVTWPAVAPTYLAGCAHSDTHTNSQGITRADSFELVAQTHPNTIKLGILPSRGVTDLGEKNVCKLRTQKVSMGAAGAFPWP